MHLKNYTRVVGQPPHHAQIGLTPIPIAQLIHPTPHRHQRFRIRPLPLPRLLHRSRQPTQLFFPLLRRRPFQTVQSPQNLCLGVLLHPMLRQKSIPPTTITNLHHHIGRTQTQQRESQTKCPNQFSFRRRRLLPHDITVPLVMFSVPTALRSLVPKKSRQTKPLNRFLIIPMLTRHHPRKSWRHLRA